jgi:hypothetical protein
MGCGGSKEAVPKVQAPAPVPPGAPKPNAIVEVPALPISATDPVAALPVESLAPAREVVEEKLTHGAVVQTPVALKSVAGHDVSDTKEPQAIEVPDDDKMLSVHINTEESQDIADDAGTQVEVHPVVADTTEPPGYKGDTNERGERHGKGTCTYENGSHYDGEWKSNLKDGA